MDFNRSLFMLVWLSILFEAGCNGADAQGSGLHEGIGEEYDAGNYSMTMDADNETALFKPRSHITVCTGIVCDSAMRCGAYQSDPSLMVYRPFCYDPSRYVYNPATCIRGVCRKKLCHNGRCRCPGNSCEVVLTGCSADPCPHNNICIVLVNGYRCASFPRLIGVHQPFAPSFDGSLPIRPRVGVCLDLPCPLGLLCEEFQLTRQDVFPFCIDRSSYTGCITGSCNVGVCDVATRRCSCPVGAFGNSCEFTSTPCSTTRCSNGGVCVTFPNGYLCMVRPTTSTLPATTTTTTVVFNDACSRNLCNSGLAASCRCVPSCQHEFGYYCLSSAGYIGERCDISPPDIFCNDNSIRIEVSDAFLREYAGDVLTAFLYASSTVDGLRSTGSTCRAVATGSRYVLTIPTFSDCGNTVRSTSDREVVYRNSLWVNSRPNALYDLPRPVLNFFCTYQKEYSISASLKPVVDQPKAHLSGLLEGKVSISLCKVSTCSNICPANLKVVNGAIYTVAELIHLSVSVATTSLDDPSLHAEIIDSYLSCFPLRTDTDHVILKQGCQDGQKLDARVGRRDDRTICMSFRVPRMLACSEVYIHVRMSLCAKQDFETTTCPDGTSYRFCRSAIQKRSVDHEHSTASGGIAYRVVGPITISPTRDGVGTITYNTDDGDVEIIPTNLTLPIIPSPSSVSNLDTFSVVALVCGFLLVVFTIFAFLALMLVRRRRSNALLSATA